MKIKTIISLIIMIPLILCMCLIFYFSSQDCSLSNSISIDFTGKIAEIIFRNFKTMNTDLQNYIIYELNLFIRKAAHFSIFFIMSAFIYAELTIWLKKYFLSGIITTILCMIYALFDEYHQSFTPGRTPLIKDVFIDTCGAVLGIFSCFAVISVIHFIIDIRQKNNSSQPSAN